MRIYLSNSTLMINIIIATSVSIQVMEAIICKIQRIGEWHYIPIEKYKVPTLTFWLLVVCRSSVSPIDES